MDPSLLIGFGSVALPLIIKALSDYQANLIANHNAALARLVGMAGREAATIRRSMATAAPSINLRQLESQLVNVSADMILNEMGGSTNAVSADSSKIVAIVQGELNKLLVPTAAPTVTPVPAI